MKSYIINSEDRKGLKNLQVGFEVDPHGLLTVVQVEIYDLFADSYQLANFDTYSKSSLAEIETICMDWYNNTYSQTA